MEKEISGDREGKRYFRTIKRKHPAGNVNKNTIVQESINNKCLFRLQEYPSIKRENKISKIGTERKRGRKISIGMKKILPAAI